MNNSRTISSIEVIDPGSGPDADIDVRTDSRDPIVEDYFPSVYGAENISNIGTMNILKARLAFKTMCTIYRIPFAKSNKASSLIPKDIKLSEVFDKNSERYSEARDFRDFVTGSEWEKVIDGAMSLEGKTSHTGIHAAGVLISSKPLIDVIPLMVRQKDGRVISQWEYPEAEALGLLKLDVLGLDTVDLIQNTVRNIIKNGKEPPNMYEMVHGPMDDAKTFELLGRGDTIGIFQLASPAVQDLLKRMGPKSIDDIAATTALYRPGPISVNSHIRYAERSSGREEIEVPVHEEFAGSPLETILNKTQNLIVFQEQIMSLSSEIAGMTLQEGDDLRSAMGKKKVKVMNAMRPKFFEGAIANGYSKEAVTELWDTIHGFAEYGFNKAHSYSYAILAYQTAYLKANYPIEFVSALISQNIDNKAKVSAFMKDARNKGITIGPVNVNVSEVNVAADNRKDSDHEITYGLSGIKNLSSDAAHAIVRERENGEYSSVQDFVRRCSPLGVTKKSIENLAAAGGFDDFNVSRRSVIETSGHLIKDEEKRESRGESLFEMFGDEDEALELDLTGYEEYPFNELVKREADVLNIFISHHPVERIGEGLPHMKNSSVSKLLANNKRARARLVGSISDVESKRNRRGSKTVTLTIDDSTGYLPANLSSKVVKGLEKRETQNRIKDLYRSGEGNLSSELREGLEKLDVDSIPALETNVVYTIDVMFTPGSDEDSPPFVRMESLRRVTLAHDGSLPVRLRFNGDDDGEANTKLMKKLPRALANKFPGEYPIMVSVYGSNTDSEIADQVYIDAALTMEEEGSIIASENNEDDVDVDLFSNQTKAKSKNKKQKKVDLRSWPPKQRESDDSYNVNTPHHEKVEQFVYEDTGFRMDKTKASELAIEKYLGIENYDFGLFDPSVLE